MRHHNSVFHDLLKRVPWVEFDRLVEAHGADRRVRRLPTKSQFIALLYGQLSGAVSLRERECQEFRVRAGMMGEKEIPDGPTQGTAHS